MIKMNETKDGIHIYIRNKGYGKTYYENNKYKNKIINDIIDNIKAHVFNNSYYNNNDKEIVNRILTIIERCRWNDPN